MKYETYWSMVQARMLVRDVASRKGLACPCCGESQQIELTEWMLKDGVIRMKCGTCKRDGRYEEFRNA